MRGYFCRPIYKFVVEIGGKTVSLAIVLAFVVSLAGCTKTSHGGGSSKSETFYMNLGGEPTTLHPITSTDLYSTTVQSYVMDSLMFRNEDTYEWQPALAESYEISKDGKEFTFKIRQGATFFDGSPITVADVKFSFDIIFNKDYNAAHLWPYYSEIKECVIVDDSTVKFVTGSKYFNNFDVVAGLSILPKKIYGEVAKAKKITTDIHASGPYKIASYERGKRLVLEHNTNWWGHRVETLKGLYRFNRIVMRFVQDQNVSLEMLKKGDLDYIGMSPELFVQKAQGAPFGDRVLKKQVQNDAPVPYAFVAWNLKNPMFQDRRTRVALGMLMNRELMIEKFEFGLSMPATGPWYQQSMFASPKVKALPFAPQEALKLLREAGWSDSDKDGVLDRKLDGKKTNLSFSIVSASKDREKYLTVYKEDLKKVGVDATIKMVEWNTLTKILDERNFEAVNLGWGGGAVDNDPKQIWHSSSAGKNGSNFIHYSNPKVDQLIDQARTLLKREERIPVMQKIYEMIAEDAPYAFMFNQKYVLYGVNQRIGQEKDTYRYSIGRERWWLKP